MRPPQSFYDTLENFKASGIPCYLDTAVDLSNYTGIVYYYACWAHSNNLTYLLYTLQGFKPLPVYVYNLDEESNHWEYLLRYAQKAGGWGDVFWFKNGLLQYEFHESGIATKALPLFDVYNKALRD